MEPRFGRLYAGAVLRPLAEQVVDMLGVQPGETACDLVCDGGTVGVALGGAVGRGGNVLLVDTDAGVLEAALRDVAETGSAVSTHLSIDGADPLAESSCDRVASLCTLAFWEGASLFDVAERAARPDGCAAVVTWDAADPPLHEIALVNALRDVAGIDSRFLDRCLAHADPEQVARWESVTLRDVVRFDGIGTYWAAMVVERPVAAELAHLHDDVLSAVRAACQHALEPCMAADGTIRIPVRATLHRRIPGSRA